MSINKEVISVSKKDLLFTELRFVLFSFIMYLRPFRNFAFLPSVITVQHEVLHPLYCFLADPATNIFFQFAHGQDLLKIIITFIEAQRILYFLNSR